MVVGSGGVGMEMMSTIYDIIYCMLLVRRRAAASMVSTYEQRWIFEWRGIIVWG